MAKIIVTGASGFVGRHLVERLASLGWSILCITRPHSDISFLASLNKNISFLVWENDIKKMAEQIKRFSPIAAVHLASYFIASHTPNDIGDLVESNILFGMQLLEAMGMAGVKNIVNTGTSWENYDAESAEVRPVCLYAATKVSFEEVLKFYSYTQNFKCITLRLFDTYGPNDTRKKIIPILLKAYHDDVALEMSPGEQELEMVHVSDVVDAFIQAVNRLANEDSLQGFCEVYGVASGNPMTLRTIVSKLESYLNYKFDIKWGGRQYREREVMEVWKNYERLKGWSPKYVFPEGLIE